MQGMPHAELGCEEVLDPGIQMALSPSFGMGHLHCRMIRAVCLRAPECPLSWPALPTAGPLLCPQHSFSSGGGGALLLSGLWSRAADAGGKCAHSGGWGEGPSAQLPPSCFWGPGVRRALRQSRRVDHAEVTGVAPGALSRPRASRRWGTWGAVKGTLLLRHLGKAVAAGISIPCR